MSKQIAINQMSFDFDVIEEDLVLNGDLHNIRKMLPKLFDHQVEDVLFAEERFKEGKGVLFTNGTGVGKTYVGLGIAYRFNSQNKRNIIIVVPTDKKANDWVKDGQTIGLTIYQLQGIKDAGTNIVVTTYANFYQNNAINEREWDLVIYDESHYLNQNQQGKETSFLEKHKWIANLPSMAGPKSFEIIGLPPERENTDEYYYKRQAYEDKKKEVVERIVNSTKVVFLSATPFAYHKSIKYADGCLFDISETLVKDENTYKGYNDPTGFDSFLVENFGYRMQYGKCTIPESGVDVNLLERNFFEKFKEQGIMSTRQLELDYDYSRHFVTIDSEIGEFINSGMEMFYKKDFQDAFPTLSSLYSKKYNYNYVNQLLECIKAKEIHHRINHHLSLGRKIVIFHSYNHSAVEHPFRYDASKLLTAETEYKTHELQKEIKKFEEQYPKYWNLDLSGLLNTRDAILEHFPKAKQYNGTIPKKIRSNHIDDFNNDLGYTQIMLIQTKAGKEGIDAHDKTGVYQRVLINLGLPTAPTEAIQTEGRIYRSGLRSNAIYEYITLQTNFERIAFGEKIAERSRTAENLAMGNLARDLETAFKEGYIDSSYEEPSHNQGFGGKEKDRFVNSISEFDKAKTYYWSRGKRNAKNKAKEGIDYFATPEPLGYKIVEWLDPKADEKGLEPSAGHGAISRFFPSNTTNHFIEPSLALSGELAINSDGQVRRGTFEEHSSINKYNFIGMNPPFGISGKTAMEHIAKACIKHSHWNTFRLISIIPGGPAMEKRLEDFFNSELGNSFYMVWQIRLPSVVFERAGTNVACRIIKIVQRSPLHEYHTPRKIDLSYINDINDFFDTIENMDM